MNLLNSNIKYCILFITILLSFKTSAQQDYIIEDMHVDINISQDGKMDIKEIITVQFNIERRGIYREIPFKYKFNDKKYKTKISNISVPNYRSKISTNGPNKKIRIGDKNTYITGQHTYEINYTVSGAIIQYEDAQEIYWNVTGNEWDTYIKNASFSITLPSSVTLIDDNLKLYTGRNGSNISNGIINTEGNQKVIGNTSHVLNSGEGMTIAIKLPKDYLSNLPSFSTLENDLPFFQEESNKPWYLAIPFLFWAILRQWWSNKRNKNKDERDIPIEYYPAEGLTSAHVGAFIDHKVHTRDVVSLIPYWATEGIIKVTGLADGDMRLTKIKELPLDYPSYEHDFFEAIFQNRNSITFSEAQYSFGSVYARVKSNINKEVKSESYYSESYDNLFKSYKWVIICLGIIMTGVLMIFFSNFILLGIGFILAGIGAAIFSSFTSPLSDYGNEIHRKLKGLEKFLKSPNEDKVAEILRDDPNYFGRMLPFAVALNLDKQWISTFDNIYTEAPLWYDSYNPHLRPTFSDFSRSFEVKEITRAFTTSPQPSSSSGGSSGGGFSGGGFGGGGGGSW